MKLRDFSFDLPPELIATSPSTERDGSRLLHINRRTQQCTHRVFRDLSELLHPGDLLVLNNSRVFAARLFTRKLTTQGRVEILLLEQAQHGGWWALARTSKPLREAAELFLASAPEIHLRVLEVAETGRVRLQLPMDGYELCARYGQIPLPPYMGREAEPVDQERYQTVYAETLGSVAAPTAGLHFSPALLDVLRARGVNIATVTLHVGPGTFLPVRVENIQDHVMHRERFSVPKQTQDLLAATRNKGGRIVAVGTTATRVLETLGPKLEPLAGDTALFITPGFKFQMVDALITNFHLPESTLLMLVSAFAGRGLIKAAYAEAISQRYRFFSYGDAMLIE